MLKICANGHVTGYKKCSFCRSATEPLAPHPSHRALDKRFKRRVTQAIRDAGGIPAADLRRSYWRITAAGRRRNF